MFIENAYLTKTPNWLYWIFPLIFFGFMGLNILVASFVDVDMMIEQGIKEQGEIGYFLTMLVPFALLLGLLFLWVRYVHKQPLLALTTSRPKVDWGRIFFSFSLWTIITIITFVVSYFLNSEGFQWNFQLVPFLLLVLVSVIFIPLQAGFEEFFFRGYLLQAIGLGVGNRWVPLLFTSVVFGLMHIANPEIEKIGYTLLFYYIGTGLFLGIITLIDDGLELALGFHIANNLITALLVTAGWTAFQTPSLFKDMTEPSAGFDIFLPLLVQFPFLLIIFARKYGWSHWKEKLTNNLMSKKEFFNTIGNNNE